MTTSERPHLPSPATANEHRLCLFQATRRPQRIEHKEIRTSWGRIVVSGKLGQAHADLLDAIFFCAEKKADIDDERIKLLVDPARVRRLIGVGGEQLEKLARELAEAVVQIKEPIELASIGHLVDHIDTAARADGSRITRRNPLGGGERALWRVDLGKVLSRLVMKDVWVGYDPAPVAALNHGISQAVARLVLSHQTQPTGGWRLDGLIGAVSSGAVAAQALRDRRRELHADAEALRAVGIIIDGDRVKRYA